MTYLLAIQDTQGGDILKEKNETDCWRIIEQYSAKGLEIIDDWMMENPGDMTGVDTLLNKIKEFVPKDSAKPKGGETPISF